MSIGFAYVWFYKGRELTGQSSRLSLWFQVSEQGIEHPGNSFGPIFLLFPMNKVTRGHAHSSQGKPMPPGP